MTTGDRMAAMPENRRNASGAEAEDEGAPTASSTPSRSVLVTGGNGSLGRVLRGALPTLGWQVRTLDLGEPAGAASDAVVGSITDLDTMRRASAGMDAVVHLGGIASPDAGWDEALEVNIHGTRTVLEAARLERVERVVLASSNHAVGYQARGSDDLPADVRVRPDSFYGISKAALEALGSFYADEYGLEVTALRIGQCQERPSDLRALAIWLSFPDFVRLTHAALVSPWSGFSTVWGVSRNTQRWWSLDAGERIGFHPEDDAEIYASDFTGDQPRHVGGTAPPYGADQAG
ncbi:NAD-dependent epimerase/dehydratase family protein [Lysobacter korlensis]|uniref:NAD-dependent epimerase/dehydratase family protein n=1 Tax=Lysobacter korlensis TaxID=553636 RepID=A0ABV6RSY3_9GAMM